MIDTDVTSPPPEDPEMTQTTLPEMPKPSPPAHPLQPAEREKLELLEGVIERGRKTFLEVGGALLEINEERLYRETHASFEAYLDERWDGMGRGRAYEFMRASRTAAAIAESSEVQPRSEGQLRPLTRLEAEQQPQAWARAVELAGGDQPTGAEVAQAVRELKGEPEPAPRPQRDPSLVEGGFAEWREGVSDAPAPADQCATCGKAVEPGADHKCAPPKLQSDTARCSRCGGVAPWEYPAGFNTTLCAPCVREERTPADPLTDEAQLARDAVVRFDATDLKYRMAAHLPQQGGWQVEVVDAGRDPERTVGERRFISTDRLIGGGWSVLGEIEPDDEDTPPTDPGARAYLQVPLPPAAPPAPSPASVEIALRKILTRAELEFRRAAQTGLSDADLRSTIVIKGKDGAGSDGKSVWWEFASGSQPKVWVSDQIGAPRRSEPPTLVGASLLCAVRELWGIPLPGQARPTDVEIEPTPAAGRPAASTSKPGLPKDAAEKVAEQKGQAVQPSAWEGLSTVIVPSDLLPRVAKAGGDAATALTLGCDFVETIGEFELSAAAALELLRRFLDACCEYGVDPDAAISAIQDLPACDEGADDAA